MDTSIPAKARLRRVMKEAIAAFPADLRAAESALVVQAIRESRLWHEARSVFLYAALPTELDMDALMPCANADLKTVALPLVSGAELSFRIIGDSGFAWSRGAFGIREPPTDAPMLDPLLCPGPVLALLPGLAFDREGRRLGRGKGYYDRFLASLRAARNDFFALGAALSIQVLARVPVGSNDALLDGLTYSLSDDDAEKPQAEKSPRQDRALPSRAMIDIFTL